MCFFTSENGVTRPTPGCLVVLLHKALMNPLTVLHPVLVDDLLRKTLQNL